MFSKLFGVSGRAPTPLLESPRRSATSFQQLVGAPLEGANAKEQTSLTEQARKEALQNRLMELQAEHEPQEEGDPVADQEDIALVQYIFQSKPHLMRQVIEQILAEKLSGQSNSGGL